MCQEAGILHPERWAGILFEGKHLFVCLRWNASCECAAALDGSEVHWKTARPSSNALLKVRERSIRHKALRIRSCSACFDSRLACGNHRGFLNWGHTFM